MGNSLEQIKPVQGQQVGDDQAGSLKLNKISKLDGNQRQWRDNVMKVLGLKSTSSQGRVLAGAISNAEVIERGNYSDKDKKRARQLRAKVTDAGTPPWKDATKAERAGDAKVELDLLTIPENQRKLKPLGGGINQSFFVDRVDADGQTRHSFVCKPASKPTSNEPNSASGGPKGGEVAREALAGRAAQLLASTTGIDIGMPETHVVTMDCKYIPGREAESGKLVTCSAQEFRRSGGALGGIPQDQKGKFDKQQLAGLAIFDTLTLNTDRHNGNLLIGENNSLIPIDHGEGFPTRDKTGIGRIKATVGGPHNALLGLPGTHEPMSPEMIQKLSAMSADNFSGSLAKDNSAIGNRNPDMKGMISSGAIENTRRAARFVKLAARNTPPLSPAAIQIAMGNAADELFGRDINDKAFEKNALAVIQRAAPYQGVFKEICTGPTPEYEKLADKVEALGWSVNRRPGPPKENSISDPSLMLQIIKNNIACPNDMDEQEAIRQILDGTYNNQPMLTPDEAMETIVANRIETIRDLTTAMADNQARMIDVALRTVARLPANRRKARVDDLLNTAMNAAMKAQQERFDKVRDDNSLEDLANAEVNGKAIIGNAASIGYFAARNRLVEMQPVVAKPAIDNVIQMVAGRAYTEAAAANMTKMLRKFAADRLVPRDDDDLTHGLAEATANRPLEALRYYDTLVQRAANNEFGTTGFDALTAQVEKLRRDFTIDAKSKEYMAYLSALQAGDFGKIEESVGYLTQRCWLGTFPPSDEMFAKMIKVYAVPDDEEELPEARKLARSGNAMEFGILWERLVDKYRDQSVEKGIAVIQEDLDALTEEYAIPNDHPVYAELQTFLTTNPGATAALRLLSRLRSLAEAGAFATL